MSWVGRHTLVTGGAGFIGRYLVESLLSAGATVAVADLGDLPESLRPHAQHHRGDLRNHDVAASATAGQEVVFHVAGRVMNVAYSSAHHAEMYQWNADLASVVLSACAEQDVAQVVTVSTPCVYPCDAPQPFSEPFGHAGDPEPTNAGYAWAKRMSERLTNWLVGEGRFGAVICRPFGAAGAGDNWADDAAHVIPSLVRRALEGENPLCVWGTGTQTRTFTHPRDIATGLIRLADVVSDGAAVNIGTATETSIGGLARLVAEVCGVTPEIRFDSTRPDGHHRRACDTALLRSLTGWEPTTSLRQIVEETRDEYLRLR